MTDYDLMASLANTAKYCSDVVKMAAHRKQKLFLLLAGCLLTSLFVYGDVILRWEEANRLMSSRGCGDVCSFNVVDKAPGRFYPAFKKSIDCLNIVGRMKYIGQGTNWPPPRYPPTHIMELLTHHGELPLRDVRYFPSQGHKVDSDGSVVVSEEEMDELQQHVTRGENILKGYHGDAEQAFHSVLQGNRNKLKGAVGFTIGLKNPWVEAMLLTQNPRLITSIEYQVPGYEILTEHPQISSRTPLTAAADYREPRYDFGVAYLTVGSLGLGRYGEKLNPYADFEAMAQSWCFTKSGGVFILVVHYEGSESYLVWNAYRVYGIKLLSFLTANWEVVDMKKSEVDFSTSKNRLTPGWAILVLRKP